MQNYYKHLLLLVKRLILVMVLMTVTRLIFYIFNYSLFANLSAKQVIMHFIYGLRFDLATVFLFNLPLILFSVLPDIFLKYRWYHAFLKILFIAVNSSLVAVNLIDTKFYEFEGKRLTADFFSKEWLGNDFLTLLPEFLKDYWYMLLIFVAFIYLFVRVYPNYHKKATAVKKNNLAASKRGINFIYNTVFAASREEPASLYNFGRRVKPTSVRFKNIKQAAFGILVIILSVYLGRGGTQLKPIGIIAAARYTSPEFMALILNSPFTIVKTYGNKSLPNPEYFSSQKLDSVYNPVHKFGHSGKPNNKNVVIIILESFGREYSGFLNDTVGYTPNFDSIMQLGLTHKYAFANGRRSIEALPSIFSGLPALMDNAFVNTKYSVNSIEGLGTILKRLGYKTAFYHGGKNGTMGFDNFTRLVGIENYFGLNEYPDKSDYDGNWGVFDEPYLQYFANEVTQMAEPFFASVFTLSSHHPYKIPEQYKNRFSKGKLVNQESIGYADFALGRFFKTAATKPWFNNTLFVLTADHTAQAYNNYYKTGAGRYAIPIVFYAPSDTALCGVSDKVCQQCDIMPSVLDYIGYSEPFVAFGKSIFSKDTNRFAVSYLSGIYQLVYNNFAISFDGSEVIDIESIIADSLKTEMLLKADSLDIKNAENLLKGIIQQYNFRLEHNLMKHSQ